MKRLIITAVGLALVGGIIIGGIIGNLFGAPAQRTSAAGETGSGCYTNWNSADCAPGWTAVSTGVWTNFSEAGQGGVALICAAAKPENDPLEPSPFSDTRATSGGSHRVADEPCAICCATGPSVVGGVAEPPDLATRAGASGMGTYAVVGGAVSGGLAFAAMGIFAVKRRGVQQ